MGCCGSKKPVEPAAIDPAADAALESAPSKAKSSKKLHPVAKLSPPQQPTAKSTPTSPAITADRESFLKEIFASMDTDGDGNVSKADFESCVKSELMIKFFALMDGEGNGDGVLQLSEWLAGMGKLGTLMSYDQFEDQLRETMEKSRGAAVAAERDARNEKAEKTRNRHRS